MAMIIHLFNGDPSKRDNEQSAGFMIQRDDTLGWRVRTFAVPTGRELLRSVSDCPLTLAQNTLMWSKLFGWKLKMHPDSVSIKEIIKNVDTYTNLLQPEANILALSMLMKNFLPLEDQQQPGLPNLEKVVAKINGPQKAQQAPQPQARPVVGDAGAEAKMRRTHERYQQTIAKVNQQVENQKRQEEIANNIEAELEAADALLNEIEESSGDEDSSIEIPEVFANPEEAIQWAIDLGAFESAEDAQEAYNEVKEDTQPKSAKEMASNWTELVCMMLGV